MVSVPVARVVAWDPFGRARILVRVLRKAVGRERRTVHRYAFFELDVTLVSRCSGVPEVL